MKKFYKDFFGVTASIAVKKDGSAVLRICDPFGKLVKRKIYSSERGARNALSRYSDGDMKSV